MIHFFRQFYYRYFSDPQAIILLIILAVCVFSVVYLGQALAPVVIAAVLAYLLDDLVQILCKREISHINAVIIVCTLFVSGVVLALFGLAPLLSRQLDQALRELPIFVKSVQGGMTELSTKFPEFFNAQQMIRLKTELAQRTTAIGENLLSYSLGLLPTLLTVAVYTVLVPLLVFFFLKDREKILNWLQGFLPSERNFASGVWNEVDAQIGNYIRGKTWEILIVWAATWAVFLIIDIKYTLLLSFFIGLSVLIPYVGATLMTIPVAIVAFSQWGFGPDFTIALVCYLVIQALDGNLLVPILFSEAVNIHPVAIITAVLFFGDIWGVWGVFFAIPLATLVNAVIHLWPVRAGSYLEPTSAVPSE